MCEEKSTDDFTSCDFDAFLKSLCRFGSRYQIIENHHFLSLEIVLVDMHVIVSEVRNDVFMGIVFLGFLAVHMHVVESIFSTAKLAYHGGEFLVSPCGSICAACWDAAENNIAAILKGNGVAH